MKRARQTIITIVLLCMITGCSKKSDTKDERIKETEQTLAKEDQAPTEGEQAPTEEEPTPSQEEQKPAKAEQAPAQKEESPAKPEQTSDKERQAATLDIEPFTWCMYPPANDLSKYDFSNQKELLLTLSFSNYTKFPEADHMPKDISMEEVVEWGKYPGLHMDILYQHGLTGRNGVAALIDQPVPLKHQAFEGMNVIYHDMVEGESGENSMHGAGVLSLLAAPGIGTAPDITVHFLEDPAWEADYQNTAKAIYEIIETNKSLPEEERISMVSISNSTNHEGTKNPEKLLEALDAAKSAGVWIWMCNYPLKLNDGVFEPLSDKDDPGSVHKAVHSNATPWTDISWDQVLTVPAGGRTTAYTLTDHLDEYTYWTDGGVSWSAPYLCGLAVTAHSIAPDLTQEEMCELFLSTADFANDLQIISPVRFMAKVLRHSGDDQLADTIIKEAGIKE